MITIDDLPEYRPADQFYDKYHGTLDSFTGKYAFELFVYASDETISRVKWDKRPRGYTTLELSQLERKIISQFNARSK